MPIQKEVITRNRVSFPCISCGHSNCPKPTNGGRQGVEAIVLWLTNKIPPCKKCGREIEKRDFDGLPESSVFMKAGRRALKDRGLQED